MENMLDNDKMTISSYKLAPILGDDRDLDQRLFDHMKEVRELGETQAIANRFLDGSLIEYQSEHVVKI